jgi:hypothetical protein
MLIKAKRHGKNVHEFRVFKEHEFFLISDVHWDNPKCDRKLLKKHLDEAVKRNATILINGDLFCLMQGKGDKRGSKDDIRPEHNNGKYFDSIVETAVDWFAPYAHHIGMIGYGNHETGIIKYGETDVLQRFVDLLNYKEKSEVQVGGYGGFISIPVSRRKNGKSPRLFNIHYYHGTGGGGVVTKGVIQNNRVATFIRGVDMIWQGHVHEYYHHVDMVSRLDTKGGTGCYSIRQEKLHHLRTPCYKEEYKDGSKGWHVMRGAPPKPLGGAWLKVKFKIRTEDGRDIEFVETEIRSELS